MSPLRGLAAVAALSGAASAQKAPAFDVASVKLTIIADRSSGPSRIVARPGSLTMNNVRLRKCISWAYEIKEYQLVAPGWLGPAYEDPGGLPHVEIAARGSAATTGDLRSMLRTLLAERFKLAAHPEKRETAAYLLTVYKGGHKLPAPGDPDAEFRFDPGVSGLKLENSTMDDFADLISRPLKSPVLDRTGIPGRFTFSLDFSRMSLNQERDFYYTRALREQAGLNLERQKAQIEMLVIDHIEKQPTAN